MFESPLALKNAFASVRESKVHGTCGLATIRAATIFSSAHWSVMLCVRVGRPTENLPSGESSDSSGAPEESPFNSPGRSCFAR